MNYQCLIPDLGLYKGNYTRSVGASGKPFPKDFSLQGINVLIEDIWRINLKGADFQSVRNVPKDLRFLCLEYTWILLGLVKLANFLHTISILGFTRQVRKKQRHTLWNLLLKTLHINNKTRRKGLLGDVMSTSWTRCQTPLKQVVIDVFKCKCIAF